MILKMLYSFESYEFDFAIDSCTLTQFEKRVCGLHEGHGKKRKVRSVDQSQEWAIAISVFVRSLCFGLWNCVMLLSVAIVLRFIH